MPLKAKTLAWSYKVNAAVSSLLQVPPDVVEVALVTGSPPPTPTSYQLVPGFSSCHLVFSYQAPHSVYLNFSLISLTERQDIQIPSLLPGTSFEMGLKRSI